MTDATGNTEGTPIIDGGVLDAKSGDDSTSTDSIISSDGLTDGASADEGGTHASPSGDEPIMKEPENYELKLSNESLLNNENVKELEAFARENDISNKLAQNLLKRDEEIAKRIYDNQEKAIEEQAAQWKEQVKSDKEIGGPAYSLTVENVNRALKKYATKEVVQLFQNTGLANNPDLVRMLSRIGKSISNDTILKGPTEVKPVRKTWGELAWPDVPTAKRA